jgi:hypothetical protein
MSRLRDMALRLVDWAGGRRAVVVPPAPKYRKVQVEMTEWEISDVCADLEGMWSIGRQAAMECLAIRKFRENGLNPISATWACCLRLEHICHRLRYCYDAHAVVLERVLETDAIRVRVIFKEGGK